MIGCLIGVDSPPIVHLAPLIHGIVPLLYNRIRFRDKRLTIVFLSCRQSWLEFLPRLVWIELRHGCARAAVLGPKSF